MSNERRTAFSRTTTLGADEWLSRLTQAGRDEDWAGTPDPDAMDLRIETRGRRFTVRNAVDGWPPRALRRQFDGEVTESPGGSILQGRFRLHTMTRVALTLWFLSMSLIVVIIAAGNVSGSAELPAVASGWAGIAAPVVMVGAAAVLVRSSLAQSQRLEEDVRRFLIRLTSNGTG